MTNPPTNKLPRYVHNPLVHPTPPAAEKASPPRTTAAASPTRPKGLGGASDPDLVTTEVRRRTVVQARAMRQGERDEFTLQRKNLWERATQNQQTALEIQLRPLLNVWGLEDTLALLEDRPGLMDDFKADYALKTALRVLAKLHTGEDEGVLVPARVSEIIDWVFGPALAQRSTKWLEAAVSGLCAPGTCWPEQLAAAVVQRGADLPLHHLHRLLAMPRVPHDVPAFFAANTSRLKPSKFGLLVHAWFTRIRQQSALDGKSTKATAAHARKSADELYRAALRSILDAEEPAPDWKTRRWAQSLRSIEHLELIRKQPGCSLGMRMKLLSLVASARDRDLPMELLHWQRDQAMDQLTAAATQGLSIERLHAVRSHLAQRLGTSYRRLARRCLEQLDPSDASTRERHERLIATELDSLQSLVDTTGNLRELKMAIQRSLLKFREALRADPEPAHSVPAPRKTTACAPSSLASIPIPGTVEENAEPSSQDRTPLE